jgi:hypothetical protein
MTTKQTIRLLSALPTVFLCAAVAQQQVKPNRTISYFTKNDSKYGEVLAALGEESKCATVDVNVHDDTTNFPTFPRVRVYIDKTHETWWLVASPKGYSGYKKYRYNYVLEPPGTLTPNDMVLVISDKTSRRLAERVCSQVTGMVRGARIHAGKNGQD